MVSKMRHIQSRLARSMINQKLLSFTLEAKVEVKNGKIEPEKAGINTA
jgi:hypothetical protein